LKLDALDHPKTHDFVSRLHISRPTAIGHLELLWAFTGKNAPQGDLGKWPDGAIASACEWAGDPSVFIAALVDARFLDRDSAHRLRVHDWHEHAPGWVRAKLKGMRKEFVIPSTTKKRRTPRGSAPPTPRGTAPSIQGKGREVKGSEGKRSDAREAEPQQQPEMSQARDLPDPHELLTRIQAVYPPGTYRGSNWILAEREISKLLDGGEHPDQLLALARAFRAQQDAKGSTGTQFVLSPEKFFGPDGHWRGPFPIPTKAGLPSASDRIGWRPDDETAAAGAA
jgi:hypothetical protein